MSHSQTIGIDTAKRIFFLHGESGSGKVTVRQKLARETLVPFLANQPPSTIAMEAGCGAHHWARTFAKLGHQVRLIHPKFVRPFVKTNKNDWNDAAAICEAAQRPTMRFVAVKSLEQQDLLALHRVRARLVAQRTGLCCQIRGLLGLLAEYGIVLPVTVPQLRRALPKLLEETESGLTPQGRQLIASLRDELYSLQERIEPYEEAIERASMNTEACRRLRDIPGIGPISATALVATMGDPRVFKNGRHFAAFLGLVPRQHSSGGKSQLGRISRRGDVYIRRILIQGAHTTLRWLDRRRGPRAVWIRELVGRRRKKIAAVALANKNARMAWRLIAEGCSYSELRAAA